MIIILSNNLIFQICGEDVKGFVDSECLGSSKGTEDGGCGGSE